MVQNYITQKIITDAHNFADAIFKDAKTKAAEQLKNALTDIQNEETIRREQYISQQKLQADQQAYQAEMDMRKTRIDAKQAVFDQVFAEAKEKLDKMSGTEYRALVTALIKKYGKTGDTVIVSKADGERLSAAFFKSAELGKMKLTKKIDENAETGITLTNNYYDLHLTNSELLAKVRTDKQAELAKILFDE